MRYSELGFTEFSEMRVVPEVKVVDYDYSDVQGSSGSGTTLSIPIPADTVVLAVCHEVVTSLASGTTLAIGDGDDDNMYAETGDLTLATVGNFFNSMAGSRAYNIGKKYNSTGKILLTFAASPSAGSGRIYLWFIPSVAATWRKPAAGSQTYAAGVINS